MFSPCTFETQLNLAGRRAEMASSQRSPVSKVHLCSSDQRRNRCVERSDGSICISYAGTAGLLHPKTVGSPGFQHIQDIVYAVRKAS